MTEQQQAAMRQALEALETPVSEEAPIYVRVCEYERNINKAITALRPALEQQPADEPPVFVNADHLQGLTLGHYGSVEIYTDESEGRIPLYTRPQPAAQWVGLTDEEMKQVCYETFSYDHYVVARAVEAKLREKNGGNA